MRRVEYPSGATPIWLRPNFLIWVVLLGLAACGATAREKTIRATLTTTNAARDGFVSWDKAHQIGLVDAAKSRIDGVELLAAYRQKRARVVEAFEAAYRVIAAAAILDKSHDLSALVQTAATLHAALVDLGVIAP